MLSLPRLGPVAVAVGVPGGSCPASGAAMIEGGPLEQGLSAGPGCTAPKSLAQPMLSSRRRASFQPAEAPPDTIGGAVAALARHPLRWLVRYWNWKNAALSALLRAAIFFLVNLTASWGSAASAALTELVYRAPLVGTLASLSQSFRRVQPAWKGTLVMMVALPAVAHGVEFVVHSLQGTARLYESVAASIAFSMVSCVVSYLLHRRGVLIVGHGARPFATDLIQLPVELFDLLLRKPLGLVRKVVGRGRSARNRD